MKGLVRQRARMARVRRLQHNLAASRAAEAAGQLRQLEMSSERLAQMRRELVAGQGLATGAALASAGELAMRLDAARAGLGQTIEGARAAVAMREQARLHARREQESAEKLESAAWTAAEELADRKLAKVTRLRVRRTMGE